MNASARSAFILLGLATAVLSQEAVITPEPGASVAPPTAAAVVETPTPVAAPTTPTPTAAEPAAQPEEKKADPVKEEQEKLAAANGLAAAKLTSETNELRAEITRLKMERELLAERLALASVKLQAEHQEESAKMERERASIVRESELTKARAELLTHELKAVQSQSGIEVAKLQNRISEMEMEARHKAYANAKPVYLENPLRDDGTLVISDRRISLNGAITMATADHITDRIDFFNNADRKLPIFIVIDQSPGGSVMAGYRILKAMESSSAPVHVVVKSFAASMAAAITTLAQESYAYPNAILLHHQISATLMGQLNLTEQAEFVKESQRWWTRLATPVAAKMGISTDDFIRRMYSHSTSGDWSEFGEDAKALKWVNHIVNGIEETSFIKSPDLKDASASGSRPSAEYVEELDDKGRPVSYLPRLTPKDVYFLYNPDGYFRVR